MDRMKQIVEMVFKDVIAINAWLDDFWYYINVCTEPDFIDTLDMQRHYFDKA